MKPFAHPPRHAMRANVLAAAVALACLATVGTACAQDAVPQESAMIKLIRGLIQSGALEKNAGEALLAQAQTEAMAAQMAQRAAPAGVAAGVATGAAAGTVAAANVPGEVRVPYIPETVRDQIRDDVKGEVMAQAKAEGWAAPNETPEWTKRIRVEGDVRLRNESRFYSGNNSSGSVQC